MSNINASYISPVARRRARRWFIPRIILIGLLATVAQFYLPWWSLVIACALMGFLTAGVNASPFTAGFLALFLSWSIMAIVLDIPNESRLSSQVVQLFPLGGSVALLIVLTGVFGGIIGGFATWMGDAFRRMFIRN
jgi:hypothetical protein